MSKAIFLQKLAKVQFNTRTPAKNPTHMRSRKLESLVAENNLYYLTFYYITFITSYYFFYVRSIQLQLKILITNIKLPTHALQSAISLK